MPTIGRKTFFVDCRETPGFGIGGGLASKGTLSEAGELDVVVLSMGPSPRHITKPVCEITYGLREAGIQVSVLVLEAGLGPPEGIPGSRGQVSGITEKEVAQINRHKLAIIHSGNIPAHFLYKAKVFLRHVRIPAIVVCQAPVTLQRYAEIGVRVRGFPNDKAETKGEVVDIVTGVIRGHTVPKEKLEEIVEKVKYWLSKIRLGKLSF
ncbi:MAG: methyl-coenzyme M reductase I operon protein C [Candidatus Methanospirareceae archaeon]